MEDKTRIGPWGRLSIGQKLLTVVLVFVVAFSLLLVQIGLAVDAHSDDFVAVDIVGRQRMLNQHMTVQALLVSHGMGDREELARARRLLEESQEALARGGPVQKALGSSETVVVPPPPNEDLERALREQGELVPRIAAAAEAVASSSPDDPLYAERVATLESITGELHVAVTRAVKLWTATFRRRLEDLLRNAIAFAAVAIAAASGIAFLVTRSVVRPLGAVVEQAQRIGRGDLTADLPPLRTHDEIGKLAVAMDQMVGSLRRLTGQTREVTGTLATTVSQVYASTRQQSAASKELAGSVQEITSTVQEIHRSGTQMGDRAKEVAESAEESSDAGEAGRLAAHETNRNMDSIREQVEELAENIVSLSEKTQTIGEIIAAVTDMAEQSNLLSLNATIESASAGEHGSRFSVVANEMKNLADQAKTSTVQVRTILSEIQKGINTSVMLTEETVKRVESGKSKADVAEETIGRMREVTLESLAAFQQIVGGTYQQQIGFDQVSKGMEDVRRACEQSAEGTSQLEEAAATLSALTEQLRASVEVYRV